MLFRSDETALRKTIQSVIQANPKQLEQYFSGKDKLFGFFMGQCQKTLKGKANPQRLKDLLQEELKKVKNS